MSSLHDGMEHEVTDLKDSLRSKHYPYIPAEIFDFLTHFLFFIGLLSARRWIQRTSRSTAH